MTLCIMTPLFVLWWSIIYMYMYECDVNASLSVYQIPIQYVICIRISNMMIDPRNVNVCNVFKLSFNNLTHKNLRNKFGSIIRYMPFNCKTTNYDSIHTSRDQIPWEMASYSNSIMTLYSTTLFDDGQRHTPPEDTTWTSGV